MTVVVKEINSRKVFITGNVERPGTFPLLRATTVLQLIALAGGLKEFAKAGDILVVRNDGGQQGSFTFNYDDLKNARISSRISCSSRAIRSLFREDPRSENVRGRGPVGGVPLRCWCWR